MDPISLIRQSPQGMQGIAAGNPALQRAIDAAGQGTLDRIPESVMQQLSRPASGQIPGAGGPGATSFENVLGGLVKDVAAKQAQSSATVNALLAGGDVPLHQAMIASEEASVSFQLMVEVRNKLLESYQELMRMQV